MRRWRARGTGCGWVVAGLLLGACRADVEGSDAVAAGAGAAHTEAVGGEPAPVATARESAATEASEPAVPACGAWPYGSSNHVLVRACVMSADLPSASELGLGPAPVLEFLGRVTEINGVTPDEHCLGFIALNGVLFKTVNEPLDARWLRAEDDTGKRIEIGVLAPKFSWRAAVGDRIAVTVELEGPSFAALPRQQVLVRAQTGELLSWFGEAISLEDLHTPRELQLSSGAVTCFGHHHCTPKWGEYELSARVDGADRQVSIRYGEVAELGDFAIVHGGLHVDLEGSSCPESGLGRATAGVWRLREALRQEP